jgi:hypothetical protein
MTHDAFHVTRLPNKSFLAVQHLTSPKTYLLLCICMHQGCVWLTVFIFRIHPIMSVGVGSPEPGWYHVVHHVWLSEIHHVII